MDGHMRRGPQVLSQRTEPREHRHGYQTLLGVYRGTSSLVEGTEGKERAHDVKFPDPQEDIFQFAKLLHFVLLSTRRTRFFFTGVASSQN